MKPCAQTVFFLSFLRTSEFYETVPEATICQSAWTSTEREGGGNLLLRGWLSLQVVFSSSSCRLSFAVEFLHYSQFLNSSSFYFLTETAKAYLNLRHSLRSTLFKFQVSRMGGKPSHLGHFRRELSRLAVLRTPL